MKLILLIAPLLLSVQANAETVKIGSYSGKPGYFAKIGTELDTTLDAVIMNAEAAKKVSELKLEKLGDSVQCEVDGMQQAMGYTIFKVKSCK